MKEYGPCPFGASTLVAFRKRFSEEDMAVLLEASVPKPEENKDDPDDKNDRPNSGTLILDATCCPADIAYPQDADLLNQARENVEKTVDELCKQIGQKKPRIYRKRARKDYLRLAKSKKRSAKTVRTAVRKQLQYIRRDIGYVVKLLQNGADLSQKQADRLNVVTTVYEQQRIMFESGTHSIPRRIVSLAQPWASRRKIAICLAWQKSRSIRTVVTATQWKVSLEQARPLMASPASWCTCGKPHVASSVSPSCS